MSAAGIKQSRRSSLLEALDRLDLTQAQAAILLDVSRRTMTRWCNGQSAVPRAVWLAVLGLSKSKTEQEGES